MQRRVVVGVSGSLGSLTALHRATAEAQERNAELYAVLAWQLPGGGLGSRATYGTALLGECRAAARDDLCTALDTAFAAGRPGVTLVGCTVRATRGRFSSTLFGGPTTSWSSARASAAGGSLDCGRRWPGIAWHTRRAPCSPSLRTRSKPKLPQYGAGRGRQTTRREVPHGRHEDHR